MLPRFLTALPVFNEVSSVESVLDEVRTHCTDILVIDDGSRDGTAEILAQRTDIQVVTHEENRGYGAALRTAFCFAVRHHYELVVTIDCDGQHEPQRIPNFVAACAGADVAGCAGADIVSGSRYLRQFAGDDEPPSDRLRVNQQVTAELNGRLGLQLTDAFCGFKAYRVDALRKLQLTEDGYAMPLELWVQAAHHGLRIIERPVPLIYLDESRSFGGELDDAHTRLEYYHFVLNRSLEAVQTTHPRPLAYMCGEHAG